MTSAVVELARQAGARVDDVLVSDRVDTVPSGPSDRWALVPHADGTTSLGGIDRGTWRIYGRYETDRLAANALVHVLRAPTFGWLPPGEIERLSTESKALAGRLQAQPTIAAADVPVGTALDHLGSVCGHVAFLLDTPFQQRSAPPTDLELGRLYLVLRAPLTDELARISPMQPWFGQPGGGIAIWLAHPLRWFYDTHLMDLVAPGIAP